MSGQDLSISYGSLPAHFFTRVQPTRVEAPRLIAFNHALAEELNLGMESFDDDTLAAIFSGNRILEGSVPLAMVYAGHQFGHFVPQLGDGRAILLAEVHDRFGQRRDIQLKGSGRTPYSRGGDGRAALGPVLREYVVSEAMHALGIPATRALAAVTTGEGVMRETRLPGAIVTRVAASHVRVGTFQFFAARGDTAALRLLADYVIDRHYPDALGAANPYEALLRGVVQRQAALIAAWMNVGFIHGVMNTDNMAVSGETIDFGPCAFVDEYDPMTVFSSIDHQGRYAYANQPAAGQWNLARFAETLLPLIDPVSERAIEVASGVVTGFMPAFDAEWLRGMRRKMGLFTVEEGDLALARALLDLMQREHADFTVAFRGLADAFDLAAAHGAAGIAGDGEWADAWRARLWREPQSAAAHAGLMRSANPSVIPRNHRIEQAIVAAVRREDFGPFQRLCAALSTPFDTPAAGAYADPPQAHERVLQTFCGT